VNKKIAIGIIVAVVASAIVLVGLKGTLGDKADEIPGEENTEEILNIQEKNTTSSKLVPSTESGYTESKELGP